MQLENKFKWCLKKGREGGHGLIEVKPSEKLSNGHIERAKFDLEFVDFNQEKFPVWALSGCYYAIYHSLLAILYRFGYESTNQECTVTAIEYLIHTEKIKLEKGHIELFKKIRDLNIKKARSLREQFQYGINFDVDKEIFKELKEKSIAFVEFVEGILKEIK